MKIAAVFATMNRSATAVACVTALAKQSRPPELVCVADNDSDDTTVRDLEDLRDLPFRLLVLRMGDNTGNAGGVAAAIQRAYAEGAKAAWILDDDSWPRMAALEALLEGAWDGRVVRHSLQVDPESGKFTWPLPVREQSGETRLVWSEEELPVGEWVDSLASWTGALVPREVWETCGPVMAELFIRGEDEEYPARIASAGFGFRACRGSVLDHPGPRDLVMMSFLGKRLFFEKGLSDWKLHYKVRNMVWLKRRDAGSAMAIIMATAYAFAALRHDGIGRLPLVAKAAAEGWCGKLGRIGG